MNVFLAVAIILAMKVVFYDIFWDLFTTRRRNRRLRRELEPILFRIQQYRLWATLAHRAHLLGSLQDMERMLLNNADNAHVRQDVVLYLVGVGAELDRTLWIRAQLNKAVRTPVTKVNWLKEGF